MKRMALLPSDPAALAAQRDLESVQRLYASPLLTALFVLATGCQTGRVRSWQLTHRDQQHSPLTLRARMTMSDSEAACASAMQGLGIALVSMPFAVAYLHAGTLQRVLPDWFVDDGNISIYYAEHKLLPGKTRAFGALIN